MLLAFGETKKEKVDTLYFGGKASDNYKDMQFKLGEVATEDESGKRNLDCSTSGTDPVTFTCKRSLDTGDTTSPDKILQCGQKYTFEYLGCLTTAEP